MSSLFDPDGNAATVHRIRSLTADSRPLWGKMTNAQMLAHCRQGLLVATGELKLERSLVGLLFGRLVKKKVLGPEPFKRGLPTDKAFVPRGDLDFESERSRLIELVQRVGNEGPGALTNAPHPFFGPMTREEWDGLSAKHLDHHLRQFGA